MTPVEQKIQNGIKIYLTPLLVLVTGYLLNDKMKVIDRRMEMIEEIQGQVLEVRYLIKELDFRMKTMEQRTSSNHPTPAAKHEEIFTLNNKKKQ